MNKGFDPIFDENSRVLILGSFPSKKSRDVGFYYGNKQNRFWKTLAMIFDHAPLETINEKIDFLKSHNIALYDVIAESDIEGSADQALIKSNNALTSLGPLLPPHTKVEKILCNGKAAFNILCNSPITIPIIYLPSTSPANVSFNPADWFRELNFLK